MDHSVYGQGVMYKSVFLSLYPSFTFMLSCANTRPQTNNNKKKGGNKMKDGTNRAKIYTKTARKTKTTTIL